VISKNVLYGRTYQQLLSGVHAVAGPVTHEDRIRATRLAVPAAVLGGISALWVHGANVAWPDDPVEIVLPPAHRVRSRALLRVRGDVLLPAEVMASRFGPVTTPARTAFDVGRHRDPLRAVPLLDALVRATSLTREQVEEVAGHHRGVRFIRELPNMLDLVDGGAESVRESELRVVLVQAGLPRPVTQYTVRTADGMFVARVDLAWPELRVAVEYDGSYHDDPRQIAHDRARLNALRAAGWTVLVIDRAQFTRCDDVVEMVRKVLTTAGHP
jgi:very-short-patch-repair endonuclease